jgi:glycosyltransferase involved in cell wall biosynthesis
MRIAIDTRLLGSGNHSGVEEYTENIVEKLVAQNPDDTFLFFHNGIKIKPLPKLFSDTEGASIINWRLPNRALDLLFRLRLYKPKFGADIFFSPNLSSLQTSIPHIITIHDLSFMHYPEFFTPLARAWHLTRAKLQSQKATHIITDSEFTKNDLITLLKTQSNKISVIPLGLNPQFKKIDPADKTLNDFKNKHDLTFPFILYLGTLEPRKNIPTLIRAWNIVKQKSQFRDLRLILAGKKGWLYQDIIKEIAKSAFKKDIILFGPINSSERVLLYNLSKAFVYPSFFEGFGLPPLEAQACGVPVITSDRTALAENLTGSAILINPWKINNLALAIEQTISNERERETLIAKGLENIKRFNWTIAGKATMNILKKFG